MSTVEGTVGGESRLVLDRREAIRARRRRRVRSAIHVVVSNPLTLIGFLIVAGLVVIAVIGPSISPYDPIEIDVNNPLLPPSSEHWFGTDTAGRDILSRVLYGTRISLRIGALAVGTIMLVGVPLGLVAGTIGGWVDAVIMRVADVFLAFPTLVLALAIATALGGGMQNVIVAVAIAGWPWYARLVRSVVLSVRRDGYVEAALLSGASWPRIVRRHIFPNSFGPVIVQASQDMGYTILLAASLGFIGVGVKIPTPEWGAMINDGRSVFMDQWWVAGFPGLAIIVTVLAFSLLGDGVRDILDPKLRR